MAQRQRGSTNLPAGEEAQKLNYLQPEILPVQVMVDVLKERGIKPAILQQAERLKIIHLFYKYVSPKYQRDCRNNHRGKLLKKIRESKATHLKDEDWKMLVVESKGNIFPSLSTKSTVNNDGERLKPPPSCINTERKIIKLGSVSKTSSTGLDFLIIKKDDSEVSEDKESNKKQKLLKEKRKMQCEEETKMKKMKVDHEENEAVLSVY
ncbi:uncharacterized protein LOC123505615 isoform X2 [Portunus trituberculatus]|uniref:uncharacterized protein LOC123505615 isoform X2 n=1 Tax=Portunus trituberculatus TaxID=210409 RepID=UPI001E1CCF21|nr:uncharacterized protein LOC123505615 isoform X2 [Portunus trituberculatus]XP_045113083.1 uncharacterized protein LOC123505615 isoform X2 [Portunus trituberculatus]XP_045113084.1 uncharacterized protein LOC123505615 isoform X2 [Portunus trituberculatus]